MSNVDSPSKFPLAALAGLAVAIFVSTTCEFMPGGLIPLISADMSRSVSDAGLLVAGFAIAVVVSATPLTVALRRAPRKWTLIIALAVFGLLNVLTAAAPTFEILVVSRVLGGAAHGLFFSVLFVYPPHLVPPTQLSRATAITALGGSLAAIVGIPVGNALGQFVGWRASFAVFAGLILLVALVLTRVLPAIEITVPLKTGEIPLQRFGRDRTLPVVLGLCVLIVVVVVGQVSYGTYSAAWLIDVAGFPSGVIPLVLLTSGIAGAFGLAVKAVLPDRFPQATFVLSLALVVAVLVCLPFAAATSAWMVVVLLALHGIAFGGVPAMMQTRMMMTASPRVRGLAASLQATAFNVGIGAGAITGGVLIDTVGLGNLTFGAAALAASGLLFAVGIDLADRRRRRWG